MKVTKTVRLDKQQVREAVLALYPHFVTRNVRIVIKEQRYQGSEPESHVAVVWEEEEVQDWVKAPDQKAPLVPSAPKASVWSRILGWFRRSA